MLPIHRILHPTDFSEQSAAAFELACALARDYKAELVVLHVYSTSSVYVPDGIAIQVPGDDPYRARVQLYEIQANDPRVTVRHVLVEGNPVDQILNQANLEAADLIVMGTHGTSGLVRLLMGSVAESVTRKATCPVLTLRKSLNPIAPNAVPELVPTVALS
jgi:nucleotide-binding universal stress UspA family protein